MAGKVIAVTGASSGLGRAAALCLAREGASLLLTGRDMARLEALAGEVGEGRDSDRIVLVPGDISREEDCERLAEMARNRFGLLDGLFACAGIMPVEDGGLETSLAVWQQVLETNLTGIFLTCRHLFPLLERSGSPEKDVFPARSALLCGSVTAWRGSASMQLAYTASKAAIVAMARELAVAWAPRGVRVNSISPGPVRTPLVEGLLSDPAALARRLAHCPGGRLGEPDEIASLVLFLLGEEASWITGADYVIDGGLTAAYVTGRED